MVLNGVGGGLSYLVGPYLVPENLVNTTHGITDISNISGTASSQMDTRYMIWCYMVEQAIVSVSLFLSIVLYFPAKPQIPPSVSASTTSGKGTDLVESVKIIFCDRNIMLCVLGCTLCTGVQGSWMGVMTLNFEPLGISEKECGNIGVILTFVSILPALAIPIIMDHIRKQFKVALVLVLAVTTGFYVWLTLIILKVLTFNWIQLYVSTIGGGSSVSVLMPLYFEYTAEIAYPVSEGVIGGVLSLGYNVSGIIFFSLFFIKNIGTVWMNYMVCASTAFTIPLVILTIGKYKRSELDNALCTS